MPEPLLLDDHRLAGPVPVWRLIGPELPAVLVDRDDLHDGVAALSDASELWGGGARVCVPMRRGGVEPDEAWSSVFADQQLDYVDDRALVPEVDLTTRLHGLRVLGPRFAESIWSVIAAQGKAPEEWSPVHEELPSRDDPWFVAYACSMGVLPEHPNATLLERAGLAAVEISDLISVKREVVHAPNGQDLLRRLREPNRWFPRRLSLFGLGVGSAPISQDLVEQPQWSDRHWNRLWVGPNIVIVYEPGSVDDLCLLWTLIAAHGFADAFPLGLPSTVDLEKEIRTWTDERDRSVQFALSARRVGRPFALTSFSVELKYLEELRVSLGGPWRVFPPEELLQTPRRPAVRSTDVAFFQHGEAAMEAWDSHARELLSHRSRFARRADLRVRVVPMRRPVPPLSKLRSDAAGVDGWRAGGFDRPLPDTGDTLRVEFPSGFNILRAAAEEHGLRVRPSAPGRAAQALLDRLGDLGQIDPLKDTWILETLDLLALRRGMSWFRDRLRRLIEDAGAEEDLAERVERIEDHLAHMTAPVGSEEQSELAFAPVSQRLGAKTARLWLSWAEERGLLIRGVKLRCMPCGARSWRTTAELGPPITCPGCGRTLRRPFPADRLEFQYRASQVLLNVMEHDAVGHLVAASRWAALFRSAGLYGIHPGVEFLSAEGQVLAEVDVVLLLPDGRLALGECKRRAVGLTDGDVDRLERLADRVDAAWTFYATPQWASACTNIWAGDT